MENYQKNRIKALIKQIKDLVEMVGKELEDPDKENSREILPEEAKDIFQYFYEALGEK